MDPRGLVFLQLFLQLFHASWGQSSRFVRDYFVYRRVPRVVGLSCGDAHVDFQTVKLLNEAGILTIVKGPDAPYNFRQLMSADYWTLGIFVDLRCPREDVERLFYESSINRMYEMTYNWLLMSNDANETVKLLNDTTFSVSTDLVISVEKNEELVLYDVYNPCKYRGGRINVTKFGTWSAEKGLDVFLIAPKLTRRWNFHGMTLNVSGIVQQRPKGMALVDYLQDENSRMIENWSKFGYSVMMHVAEILNFTMHVTELNRWEKNDSNGPLMNGLRRGDIDLGYYPAILTKERLDYARVIVQAWPIRTCFMFRSPPSKKIRISMILGPLASETWHMIAAFAALAIILLSMILKLERSDRGDDKKYDYGVSTLMTIAAICQQGVASVPDLIASRIAFLQIAVFGLLVYNYYSAAIVSARLNEPMDKMNDSLFSLVNSGMKLSAERIVFFNFLLRDTRPEVQYFRNHWTTVPESQKFMSIEDGIRSISHGGFAYHADPNDAYPYIDRYFDKQMICQLTEVHLLRPSEIGLWSSHNGQFFEVTKIGLLKIASTGLRRRQVKRWSSRKPYCQKDGLLLASVTIYEAAPIIILLLCGMTLAIVICFVENVMFYSLRRKMRRERSSTSLFVKNKITQQMILSDNLAKIKATLNQRRDY